MRRNRGTVFVITLAVLAGLVALVAAIAASHREGAHAEFRRLEDRRASLMAEAAVQHAISILQQQTAAVAQKSDPWATTGSNAKVGYTVDTDSYRIQILDAGSRINLNTVQEDQLKRLPLSADQVASVLDWREAAKSPRASGAKDSYYNGLANPYNAKLQPFDTVDELLLVKGFIPTMLYDINPSTSQTPSISADLFTVDSVSADLNPTGQPKVNLTQASLDQLTSLGISPGAANALVQAHPSSLGDALRLPDAQSAARTIAASTTVFTDPQQKGLINVNTASEAVLGSLPGVSADIASSIVSRQSVGFKSLGDLLDVPGIDVNTLAGFIDRVCVSSKAFLVRCMGISGSAKASIEAALQIDANGQVHVNRIGTAPYRDMTRIWNWDAETSSKVEMGGDQ